MLTPVEQRNVEKAVSATVNAQRWLMALWHFDGAGPEIVFNMAASREFPRAAHGEALHILVEQLERRHARQHTRESGLIVAQGGPPNHIGALKGTGIPVEADTPPFEVAERFCDAARRLGLLTSTDDGRLERTYYFRNPV